MVITKNSAIRVETFSLFMAEYFCVIDRYLCNENIHEMCPLHYLRIYCSYCNIIFFGDYFLIVDTRLQKTNSKGLYNYKCVKSHEKKNSN